jgi:hypothetical protein
MQSSSNRGLLLCTAKLIFDHIDALKLHGFPKEMR